MNKFKSIIVISLLAVILISPIAFASEQDIPPDAEGNIGVSRDKLDTPIATLTAKKGFLFSFLSFFGLKEQYSETEEIKFAQVIKPHNTVICDKPKGIIEFYSMGKPYDRLPYAQQPLGMRVDGIGGEITTNWKFPAGTFTPRALGAVGYVACADSVDIICKNNLGSLQYLNWKAGSLLGVSSDNICRIATNNPNIAPKISAVDRQDFSVGICSNEVCDGKDNNCNNLVDETPIDLKEGALCKQTCPPQVSQGCSEDNIYYFNGCGTRESIAQDCKSLNMVCVKTDFGGVKCDLPPTGTKTTPSTTTTTDKVTLPEGKSTTEEGKTGLVGQDGNPTSSEEDKAVKEGDPDINILDTKIEVKDKQVVGTIKLKNTGKAMTIPFLVEMQVPEQTGTFLAIAIPAEQKTCDPKHPENVHQTFKLGAGEETTLTLVSPQAGVLNDNFYKAGFYLRTVCWNTEFPNDARQVAGTKRGVYGYEQGLKVGTPSDTTPPVPPPPPDFPIVLVVTMITGLAIVGIGVYAYLRKRRYG